MKPSISKVIVVGASTGIGAAIAQELAEQGATVAILARRQTELEALAKSESGRLLPFAHDVRNYDEIPELFEKLVTQLGGLDLLVYAAGVMSSIEEGEYSFEKDRTMVEVNLLGAMAWCNPAAAYFEAARKGNLLGISSIAGERGRRGNPAYCTSKAAVTTYFEALRNRLSRYGVNVVTIKPGYVDTAMTRGKRGLLWLISPETAAHRALRLVRRGGSRSGFVPKQWGLVALVLHHLPSWIFRRLNF